MTLICLLIVLALEFHFKLGSQYRVFGWFSKLCDYLTELFSEKDFFDSWLGIAIILLTPLLVLLGLLSIFDGTLYWMLLFILSTVVLFLSLGPKSLEKSFDNYFKSMKRGDLEAAFLHLKKNDGEALGDVFESDNSESDDSSCGDSESSDSDNDNTDKRDTAENDTPENDELVRNATRKILVESQKRYFGVIAWFIFLGPLGALFYRLSHLYHDHCATDEFSEHLPLMQQLIHWIDWLPARLTSLLFLLTGDFVNGFYRIKDYLSDAKADNNQLISETGIAALGLDMGMSKGNVDENRHTMDMVNRTVIIYLVVAALMGTIS